MTEAIVDGVRRYPANGVRIIVVGAGNGGLQAALECWRKGCEIEVLERAAKISAIGDFFTITPPGLMTLKHYPSMHTDYHQNIYDCSIHVYSPSGKAIKSEVPEWNRSGAVHAAPDVKISFLKRRPDFAQMQLDQLSRLGVPVHFSKKVAKATETQDGVVVETEDGSRYTGDVCIAADGIGSLFRRHQASGASDVQNSGYAIARVAYPRTELKDPSPAQRLLENVDVQPEFRVYLAADIHLILFLTKDYVGVALTHKSDDTAAESWHNLKDPGFLIKELESSSSDWDPAVIDFVKQTPTDVVDWKLMCRDGDERWTSDTGRIVALGDAAHSFLPTSGNGAVQALEDAISLGECLRIGGKENVGWATKVHNKLRFERTSVLQLTGFVNRDELHNADLDSLEEISDTAEVGFFKIGKWVWAHDPEHYATENYEACLAHLKDGKAFGNTNLPPGHVYQPWSLQCENERMAKGVRSGLKNNGYWGM